ncbi:hypothetical protein BDAP_002790 [Binucleata daphniae]
MKIISGFKILEFDCIDSTQLYSMKNIESNRVVIAKNQTRGIGRSNTSWLCFDGCLCISITYKCKLAYNFQKYVLNCICEILQNKYKISAFTKWPNDIYIETSKICGVLIDRIDSYYVIGIGVNIKGKNEAYKSIKEITGIDICKYEFLECLLQNLTSNKTMKDYYRFGKNIYYDDTILKYKAVNDNVLVLTDENMKEYTFDECEWSYDIIQSKITKKC